MILAMEKGISGERYILGGDNMSYREFFSALAVATGKKSFLIPFPYFLMHIVSFLMMASSRFSHIPPLITPAWLKKYMLNWKLSTEKAEKELGYKSTPFPEALNHTIKYLHSMI